MQLFQNKKLIQINTFLNIKGSIYNGSLIQ